MKVIKVALAERSYRIVVGYKSISKIIPHLHKMKLGDSAFVLTTHPIKRQCGEMLFSCLRQAGFSTRVYCIPDREQSKSLDVMQPVITQLSRFSKKKSVFVIAFGGGVVGDLAGFVASIYKRGIPYIQVPTTLLAQVDSSIGGKTGVDLPEGKNLVGAFYQPRLVISDVSFLRSLPSRQFQSGLAEIVKYGVIQDPVLFRYLERNYTAILGKDMGSLEWLVQRCSRIKARIITLDEREKKALRIILNFGHTIGHALETAGGYKRYSHGEAVALGMLVASEMSRSLRYIDEHTVIRIERLLIRIGLPTFISGISLDRVIEAHYHDKKFAGLHNRFVLVKSLGKVRVTQDVPLSVISNALKRRMRGAHSSGN